MQGWYYGALAVAAIGGLLVALYKLRPESTRIYVDSAEVSVRLANQSRDVLAKEVADLRNDVYKLSLRTQAAEERADRAEARANAAERENSQLRTRIAHLEDEVRRLTNGGSPLNEPRQP